MPRNQADGLAVAIEINGHDRIDRLAAGAVIFAHAYDALTPQVDCRVGITPIGFRRGRMRCYSRRETIQALVAVVTEINHTVIDGKRAAAVFMRPGTGAERRGQDILRHALAPAYDGMAPGLRRAHLAPANILRIERDLAKADRARSNLVRGDRRGPGTVWRNFRRSAHAPMCTTSRRAPPR